jgi:hypothetical protein
MSVMASMLFSAYKWLLLEEWSGISINCAQQTRQVLTVSAQLIRQCSGQASTQAHSQRWFSCAKQATVQRVVGPLDVASRSQSRQPSEISRQAAIRHAQARSRARPSSGGFMRLQKTRTQNRVQNAVKVCFLSDPDPGFYKQTSGIRILQESDLDSCLYSVFCFLFSFSVI